jgi:hypothetical protein
MSEQTVCKTFKYKLMPTPTQQRELGRVLGLCRWLYNAALEQRIIAWQRVRVSISRFEQEAELKDLRASLQSTRPSIRTCCKTCWRGSTRPTRRSFVD